MENDHYSLQTLGFEGFRAFLNHMEFDFRRKRCLAVFAPNGYGKSSIIDGMEFMFSQNGTLERLGQRAVNNQAGPSALAHNQSEEAGISPSVSISIVSGQVTADGKRVAIGSHRPIPQAAKTLNECFAVDPIIRGHALRIFVENETPEERYKSVATWLQLGPLVEVQKNIRALRSQVKTASEDMSALTRIDTQLANDTSQAVKTWDAGKTLEHINETFLAPLDPNLIIETLATSDPVYEQLKALVTEEEKQIGLAGMRQMRNAADAIWHEPTVAKDDKLGISAEIPLSRSAELTAQPFIPALEEALKALSLAKAKEKEERGKAANAVFQQLWEIAEPFFDEGERVPENCPICNTPLQDTAAGSRGAIHQHITDHLEELSDYAEAKRSLGKANGTVTHARTQLKDALKLLLGLLDGDESELKEVVSSYSKSIVGWTQEKDIPSSDEIISKIGLFISSLERKIKNIEDKQGDHTYGKAKTIVDKLLELQNERDIAIRTREELDFLSNDLNAQAAKISGEIRQKVQVLINKIQSPMQRIYKIIQGEKAVPIRLELPSEDDTNQQRLNLVIDFAANRVGVQPSGYLSDSQIHSMALALRLAAIYRFNTAAPIIALDDIVTSYDADHRRNVVSLIAKVFDGSQIIITTHDERFFNYLKDQLNSNSWHFTRITGLDQSFGPRFADHKVNDEMIEERWNQGYSAANEMRQAEEEWLLGICRDFGVSVRIRPLERAYSYDRGELAAALAAYLSNRKLKPDLVDGVNNQFLTSLQKGEIENFGSHFQANPFGDGSIGDEQARWDEFKEFRDQFVCQKCGRTRFHRPVGLKKPVCLHKGCEMPFEFPSTSSH